MRRIMKSHVWAFSTGGKINVEQVRNSNLKFDGGEWTINVYPFYPTVYRKKGNQKVYEISPTSSILALTFLNKNIPDDVAWENRKSISFRFKDLGPFLGAEIGSGKSIDIETEPTSSQQNTKRIKTLTLIDKKDKQQISFKLKSELSYGKVEERQIQFQLKGQIKYLEYRVLYKLIEGSLMDLSGWRFMMEFQKRKELNKVEGILNSQKDYDDLL